MAVFKFGRRFRGKSGKSLSGLLLIHRFGGLYKLQKLVTVLEARSGLPRILGVSLGYKKLSFPCSQGRKSRGLSGISLRRALISFTEAQPSWPNYLHTASHWSQVSAHEFGEDARECLVCKLLINYNTGSYSSCFGRREYLVGVTLEESGFGSS